MLTNIFKIALRNLIKERFYTFINIFGLAIGIAASLLIISYVLHETSYDKEHPHVERLYRVNMTNIWMPGGGEWSSTIPPLAGVLHHDYPEVEKVVRVNTPGGNIMRLPSADGVEAFYEANILGADSTFFELFNFKLLHGDAATALKGINRVVVSKEIALKYFEREDVVGETLLYGDNRTPVEITGVTASQPTNQHFNFDFLISIETNPAYKQIKDTWIATQVVTYVRLQAAADPAALEKKMATIAPTHAGAQMTHWGMDYNSFMEGKGEWRFYLQPVSDIHLKSEGIGNRLGSISDGIYMYIFSFTAAFVLLLAVINFINLSTARATIRAKEVGMRKVLGSSRLQLIAQFMMESVSVCLVAGIIGLAIAEFLRVIIENFLGSVFQIVGWYTPSFYLWYIGFVLLVGLIAGIYPAFYLTRFKPSRVLKGEMRSGRRSQWFRNALVVVQFSISTSLMVGTLVVYQQLDYFNKKDLGYVKDNIIVVNWADKLGDHLEAFHHEVLQHPGVKDASISMDVIGRGNYEDVFIDESSQYEQSVAMLKVDERHLSTMGIELVQGRFFDKNNAGDKLTAVINESAMQAFGYTSDNVLDQRISYGGDDMGAVHVIGVVRDFNFYSLRYPVAPYMFLNIAAPIWGSNRVIAIKTKGNDTRALLDFLEKKWQHVVSDAPFDYSFLDMEYAAQYNTEQQLGVLFAFFTGMAILIACLGLFGLSSYTVGQRAKEIGIRKTLGASIGHIIVSFNTRFIQLVFIAMFIAIPLSVWAMQTWLDQFRYHIELEWYVFAIAAVIAMVIAVITVSYHSLKAATANPVNSLKDE